MSENDHPEHIRSFPSMATRYTVHPEHIKANCLHNWLFNRNVITDYLIASSGSAAFLISNNSISNCNTELPGIPFCGLPAGP